MLALQNFKKHSPLYIQQSFAIKKLALLFCIFSFSIVEAQKNIDPSAKEINQTNSFKSCLLPIPQSVVFSSKTFS